MVLMITTQQLYLSFLMVLSCLPLRLSSHNCCSIRNSLPEVVRLCSENDVVFLQEHWLVKQNLDYLKTISNDYDAFGVSPIDLAENILVGRPKGGVAVMWRKSLGDAIRAVDFDDPRIIGLRMESNGESWMFINVYLPTDCVENLEEMIECIGKLSAIILECNTSNIAVIGDWNARPGKPFWHILNQFCIDMDMICIDSVRLPPDTYTYVSNAHGTTSWLDHCVVSTAASRHITSMSVKYDYVISDHKPLSLTMDINPSNPLLIPTPLQLPLADTPTGCIHWDKLTPLQQLQYTNESGILLSNIQIPHHLVVCNGCTDSHHSELLKQYYDDITSCLKSAAVPLITHHNDENCNSYNVPGWNTCVSELYAISREAFLQWRIQNSPKSGTIFQEMSVRRAQFKYALRQCRKFEDQHRADAIAKSHDSGNYVEFWRKIASEGSKQTPFPQTVGGISGKNEIADLWKDHYSNILNSVTSESKRHSVENELNSSPEESDFRVSPQNVYNAIHSLKLKKSSSGDGIVTEHLKYAHPSLIIHLSLCFNSMFSHSYLPDSLMEVHIIPLVKNKCGDLTNVQNYRPIAIASSVSKVLERCILNSCSDLLSTSDNQFGFKQKHSTDQCIFVLKETVRHFIENESPTFVCFLDASKAFDKVNHWTLFDKLIRRNVPKSVVKLLVFWYRHQSFRVKWNGCFSSSFTVCNGVRQGSILSPYLFSVYLDDLSKRLNESDAGCNMFGKLINHLLYADDLAIMASSLQGLQQLLDICSEFAVEHDLVYHPTKSVCIAFLPRCLSNINCVNPTLSGNNLEFVQNVTYLGHIITHDLCDDDDIDNQRRKLCIRSNVLIRRFNRCSDSVKCTLFRSYVTPLYCCSLWHDYRVASKDTIRVTYNKALRRLFRLPTQCSVSLNFVKRRLPSFQETVRKSTCSLMSRCKSSINSILSHLTTPAALAVSHYSKRWRLELYV